MQSTEHCQLSTDDTALALRKIFAAADPVPASDVATLLLLAKGIAKADLSVETLLSVLRLDQPIIVTNSPVAGFEECLLGLLESGVVLPRPVDFVDGYGLGRRRFPLPNRLQTKGPMRWDVIRFAGSDYGNTDEDRQAGYAAQTTLPIIAVTESLDYLPQSLLPAAHLHLDCGPLTPEVVEETVKAVLGERPSLAMSPERCAHLSVSNLAMAVRRGHSPDRAVEILRGYAEAAANQSKGTKDSHSAGDGAIGFRKQDSSKHRRGGNVASGSKIFQPAVLTGDEAKDRFIPRIENLSGYGDEAREWAEGMKKDLALWRKGELAWEKTISKLLLSGASGTGKTTFARALANTLQVPMIATSVGTWLAPSYLGNVLSRMDKAFEEAQSHSPVVLLIDEIDGIGRRGGQREYDDYWNSVVNKALELLDGAARLEGVIVVGATNRPEAIDGALLRSGRLETHIRISRPNRQALAGIFRHHLGQDLKAVAASAPDSLKRMKGRSLSGGKLVMAKDAEGLALQFLASLAFGLTGADVEFVVRQARHAARAARHELTLAALSDVLGRAKPARPEGHRLRIAIHEAAHVVARIHFNLGEIETVTIDTPEGGYVTSSPSIEIEQTEKAMAVLLVSHLAGRAAEEKKFGSAAAGSGGSETSDLALATRLAFDMETKLGFAGQKPLLYRIAEDPASVLFFDRELATAVNARLEAAYGSARDLVERHMDAIDYIAGGLMMFGTLDGPDLAAVVERVESLLARQNGDRGGTPAASAAGQQSEQGFRPTGSKRAARRKGGRNDT